MDSLGKTIVLVGLILVVAGLLLWGVSSVPALSRIPLVSRIGRLPGDDEELDRRAIIQSFPSVLQALAGFAAVT